VRSLHFDKDATATDGISPVALACKTHAKTVGIGLRGRAISDMRHELRMR